jgi:hypothetical protein
VPDRRVGLGALRDDVTVKAGSNKVQRVQNPIGIGGNLAAVFMDPGLVEKCWNRLGFRMKKTAPLQN